MRAKKPTYQQRKLLTKLKLDTYKWHVQKDTPQFIQLINIETKEEKVIWKNET